MLIGRVRIADVPRRFPAPEPTHSGHLPYGFTLLEVVIATAIAALALIGLFHAGTGGMFAVSSAKGIEQGIERAQSHLAAFGRASPIAAGELEGDDGGGYHWRLRAHPVAVRQEATTAQPGLTTVLFEIDVEVSWGAEGHKQSIILNSRRVGGGSATE